MSGRRRPITSGAGVSARSEAAGQDGGASLRAAGNLFVTGAPRSGTTLLQKLLAAQPATSMLAQPFPFVFIEAKRAFLRGLGHGDDPMPLGHGFRDRRYEGRDLHVFLETYAPEPALLADVFVRMRDYPGQYDRFGEDLVAGALAMVPPGAAFIDVLRALYRGLSTKDGATIHGGKETFCEEFLPFLLGKGFWCVLIVRDPRDSIASMRYGLGEGHAGPRRPLLTDIRRWRKSVAFAVELAGTPGFVSLRYEDLVDNPTAALRPVGDLTGIDLKVDAGAAIPGPQGQAWPGNSSYGERGGVSRASVGAFESTMPPVEGRFVEALCLPEMRLFGYRASLTPDDVEGALSHYREDPGLVRPGVAGDELSTENLLDEMDRLELLDHPDRPDHGNSFPSKRVRAALAGGLR